MNTVELTLDTNLYYVLDISFTLLGPITFSFISITFA